MVAIDLAEKVALVTGASRGIGEVTARTLHACHATVILNYFPNDQHRKLANTIVDDLGSRAMALEADISAAADVARMFERLTAAYGKLDILVNNAGVLRDRTVMKMTPEEWNEVIETNLTGTFTVCQEAVRHLADGGRIINLGSIAGSIGFFGQANYAASKAGVAAMGRVLSRELGKRGITVNTVAPGVVLTEMGRSIPESVRAEMLRQIPLGRLGVPADIANAIAFLCSDLAAYISGQTLHVNGGWYT